MRGDGQPLAIAQHEYVGEGDVSLTDLLAIEDGEAVSDGSDWFGTPVVVAKRLCDRADGARIFVSGAFSERLSDSGRRLTDTASPRLSGTRVRAEINVPSASATSTRLPERPATLPLRRLVLPTKSATNRSAGSS